MVELNTLLIVGLIGFGSGALVTVAMVLLYMAYNNINVVMDRMPSKNDDDDDEGMILPLSALMGGGGAPGGGSRISMSDLQAYAARAAGAGGPPNPTPTPDDKKTLSGQYL